MASGLQETDGNAASGRRPSRSHVALAVAIPLAFAVGAAAVAAQASEEQVHWYAETPTWDVPWLPAGWHPAGWEDGVTACAGRTVSFVDPWAPADQDTFWQFGDGDNVTTAPEDLIQHAYAAVGEYTFTVQQLAATEPAQPSPQPYSPMGPAPGATTTMSSSETPTMEGTVQVIECYVPAPPNGCPVLDAGPRYHAARPDSWVNFTIRAHDGNPYSTPDALALTMAVTSSPPPAMPSFQATSDGSMATFSWLPQARDEGRALNLLVRASDGQCDATSHVSIRVSSSSTSYIPDESCLDPCGPTAASAVAPGAAGAAFADLDQDGIADNADNCPSVPNIPQADLDHDGAGDDCDADLDGDGVANPLAGIAAPAGTVMDNCPYIPNSDQADGDRDGTGDACKAPVVALAGPVAPAGGGKAAIDMAQPPSLLAVLAVAAIVAAVGAAARWWRKIPLLGVFLFSRLRTDELARHPGRAALIEAINANPGASLATLQGLTGMSRSVAAHHLKTLVRAGLVRRHEWMGTVGFHPARHEPTMGVHMVRADPTSLDAYAALRSDTARQLVESLVREPGQTLQQVSTATGLARGTVHYHLHRCAAAGLVWMEEGAEAAGPARAFPTALAARIVTVENHQPMLESPVPQPL